MLRFLTSFVTLLLAALLISAGCRAAFSEQRASLTVNADKTYQTIVGWEADAQAGQDELTAEWLRHRDTMYDAAVDLGINRLRVEIVSAGPRQKGGDFDFAAFDGLMQKVVLPMRERLQARGESLWINICVVGNRYADDPGGYAQKVLATHRHMQETYGFLPDSWEVALEPDVFGWELGVKVGRAIAAAGDLLKANGYPSKIFVAPSSSNIRNATGLFDDMVRLVPASEQYLAELSFHTYAGASDAERRGIWERARPRGLRTAQLEKMGATHDELHRDLKFANVSAWQQYVLAWPDRDDNGEKYIMLDSSGGSIRLASRAKYLRQYFKYVRRGAVRVEAASTNAVFEPVAFRNASGLYVVVVKADAGGTFDVAGLPAGSYRIKYTTESRYDTDAPAVTIPSGQALTARIPAAGVLTVYGVGAASASPAPSPATSRR